MMDCLLAESGNTCPNFAGQNTNKRFAFCQVPFFAFDTDQHATTSRSPHSFAPWPFSDGGLRRPARRANAAYCFCSGRLRSDAPGGRAHSFGVHDRRRVRFAALRLREQLEAGLKIAAERGGVVIYLRQEGRGIGLINKLKAYNLQDLGFNTAEANTHLGFDVDARQYDCAVRILQDLGISAVELITNNPDKVEALRRSRSRYWGAFRSLLRRRRIAALTCKPSRTLWGTCWSCPLPIFKWRK